MFAGIFSSKTVALPSLQPATPVPAPVISSRLAGEREPWAVAAALLNRGADPNARWCSSMEWDQYGRLLAATERPAACTLPTGTTPLILAATRCDASEVTTLVDHGADATLRDWTGRTARDYAKSCRGNVLAVFQRGR
jgi:ankyrin repeat protein